MYVGIYTLVVVHKMSSMCLDVCTCVCVCVCMCVCECTKSALVGECVCVCVYVCEITSSNNRGVEYNARVPINHT